MTLAGHFNRVCAAYSKCLKPRFGELGFQAARPLEGILVSMLCHMLQITLQYVITIHPSHAACGGLFFSGVGFCSVAASSICFNFQHLISRVLALFHPCLAHLVHRVQVTRHDILKMLEAQNCFTEPWISWIMRLSLISTEWLRQDEHN